MRQFELSDDRRRMFWYSTCEAAGSRHPLVNIVALWSIGVSVVEHGAGQS